MEWNVNIQILEASDNINIKIDEVNGGSETILIEKSDIINVSVSEGRDGRDGIDGIDGVNGQQGQNGTNGIDGDSVTVNSIPATSGNISLETSDIPESTVDYKYVTDAEKVVIGNTSGTNTGDETAARIGALINGSTAATPNDTDLVATAESSVLKKITWTNVKAFLKTYFDTIYLTISTAASTYQAILTATNFGAFINGLTGKTTPVDADSISIVDSAASNVQKKVSLTNFKAFLKTYFDTLYTKNKTIAATVTQFSHTGTTAEVVLGTLEIPANSYAALDEMIVSFMGNVLNNTAAKEFKVYINTTANLTGSPIQLGRISTAAAIIGVRWIRTFDVESTSLIKDSVSGTNNLTNDWVNNGTYSTFAPDLTVIQYIVLTGQLTSSADTILMQSLRVKRQRP